MNLIFEVMNLILKLLFPVSQLWILNLILFALLLYKSIISKFAFLSKDIVYIYIHLTLIIYFLNIILL